MGGTEFIQIGDAQPAGLTATMVTLMLAVFTVSIGIGVVLPLLTYLIERLVGVFVTRFAEDVFTLAMPAGSVVIPLAATALLAFIVALAVTLAVPSGKGRDQPKKTMSSTRSQFGLSFMRMALTVARPSAWR